MLLVTIEWRCLRSDRITTSDVLMMTPEELQGWNEAVEQCAEVFSDCELMVTVLCN